MSMDDELTKEMIRNHWRYNEGIIKLAYKNREMISKDEAISLMEYFYNKAMFHGIKHGIENRLVDNNE